MAVSKKNCITNLQAKNIKLILGDHDVDVEDETKTLVAAAKEVRTHPGETALPPELGKGERFHAFASLRIRRSTCIHARQPYHKGFRMYP